jgi:hypothetical protein
MSDASFLYGLFKFGNKCIQGWKVPRAHLCMVGKRNIRFLKSLYWLKYTGSLSSKRRDILVSENVQMGNPMIESGDIKFLLAL